MVCFCGDIIEVEPNHIEILKELADNLRSSNPKKAIELYGKLIEIHPKPYEFYSDIAYAYSENGGRLKAIAFYTKDIIENPDSYGTYSQDYIVDICKELKSKDAITILEESLSHKINANTYLVLYKLYFNKKNYQKALENALNYIAHSDEQAHNYVSIAERFFKKELYVEAEKLFNSIDIKDYFVSEIRILNYIGLCYLRKKPADVDKAYEAFMKGFKVDAKEPAIHANIYLCAVMFYQNEKYEKAIKAFKFCIENGYIKSSYYFLGVIYNDQDKNKEALSYFEKALALDPKNENIIKAIKLVKKVIKIDNSFLGKLFGGN